MGIITDFNPMGGSIQGGEPSVPFVICSNDTTWFLSSDGNLYGCGDNEYGQQGDGSISDVTTFTKRAENVIKYTCSPKTTWYVDSNNDLYGCGYNLYGQQGNGDTTDVMSFTRRGLRGRRSIIVDVACSQHTTWFLSRDGDLCGCGKGNNGQQGNGSTNNQLTFEDKTLNLTSS